MPARRFIHVCEGAVVMGDMACEGKSWEFDLDATWGNSVHQMVFVPDKLRCHI